MRGWRQWRCDRNSTRGAANGREPGERNTTVVHLVLDKLLALVRAHQDVEHTVLRQRGRKA